MLETSGRPAAPKRQPHREFKSDVLRAVRWLVGMRPEGFGHADLAARLGNTADRAMQRRVRNSLNRLCQTEILRREGRGLFVAGDAFEDRDAVSASAALMEEIYGHFYRAGGVLPIGELLSELSREDDEKARLVRKALKESDRYETGIPIDAYRTHWLLCSQDRRDVPLPGRWLGLDLRMTVAAAGGGRVSHTWGLLGDLDAFQTRICSGLRDARAIAGLSVEDVISDPAILTSFDWCLRTIDPALRLHDVTGTQPIAQFWASLSAELGERFALARVWEMLETNEVPQLVQALDVRFWVSMGALTRLDPAWLSRGAILGSSPTDTTGRVALVWPRGVPSRA